MTSTQVGSTIPSQTNITPLEANEIFISPLTGVAEYGTLNIHMKSDQDFTLEVIWKNAGNNDHTIGGIVEFKVADSPDGVISQFPVAGTSFQYKLTASSIAQNSLLISVFASYFPYISSSSSMASLSISEKIGDLCVTAPGVSSVTTSKIDVSEWASLSIGCGRIFPVSLSYHLTAEVRIQFFSDDSGGTEVKVADWTFERTRGDTYSSFASGGNYWHIPVCGDRVVITYSGGSTTGVFGQVFGSKIPVGNAFAKGILYETL